MRAISIIAKLFMWVFMVFYLLLQVMAVFGITMSNQNAVTSGHPDKAYNIVPLIVATVLMLAAVILFAALKKYKYIGIILGVIAAAIMLMVALDLGRAFPVTVGSGDTDVGLSTWKLIWRHIGISVVPLFMLIAWLTGRAADKAELEKRKDSHSYDLSGGAIFKDLDDDSGQPEPRKLKRSLKKRMEKETGQEE